MSSEQFSLCWDNFHKNMSSGMQSLLENEDLVDVTLAVEGRYLKAHKMVLSVCSPYFRQLFQTNPCRHPIVFMKDVSYIALSDLLQFMYQGEVQVAQENLPTFIKTAEALQVKGLTADGAQDSEPETTEVEKPVVESSAKPNYDTTSKPTLTARVRRPAGPASKRLKYASPSIDEPSTPGAAVTTTAVVKPDISTTPVSDTIHFKIDPESANELHSELDENQAEGTYADDTTLEETQDDTDDYALMETTDEEPKAGTSANVTGDGQDYYGDIKFDNKILPKFVKQPIRRKPDMPRFIVDGFVFHVNIMKGKPPMTYLRCLEYKRLGCHARAIIPCDGNVQDIKVKKPHNHPPDYTAEEKIVFVRELKEVVVRNPNSAVRDVYMKLSAMYPNAAREIPFNYIRHKMNRWRRNGTVQIDDYIYNTCK